MDGLKRILFVDPDADLRREAAKILRENGFGFKDDYVLVELGDHEIAEETFLRDRDFVAVICELKGPNQEGPPASLAGFRVFRTVRHAVGYRIPLIVYTTNSRACEGGFDPDPTLGFVEKTEPEGLPEKLRDLLAEAQRWA